MADDDLERRARERLGTTLNGKYRLDALLGLGGMAAVYRATHRNRAELAVKMLHPELGQNRAIRTRFLREAYAANSVKHPGAVVVVDDDLSDDGEAFLVMELLDGATVEELARLPVTDAAAAGGGRRRRPAPRRARRRARRGRRAPRRQAREPASSRARARSRSSTSGSRACSSPAARVRG